MNQPVLPDRLGFLGVGAIAEALLSGLMDSGFTGTVSLSPRNRKRSLDLAQRFHGVRVAVDNQAVVDQSQWIFLSVLPHQAAEVLGDLSFRDSHTLISLVAGLDRQLLLEWAAPVGSVFRIVPLPPIEFGSGPLPLFPPNPMIRGLFENCADVIEVADESQMAIFSAASGLMATHHELTSTVVRWMHDQGMDSESAVAYVSSIFQALGELESRTPASQIHGLADASSTAGGLNQQALGELRESGWFQQARQRLDRLLERVRHGM